MELIWLSVTTLGYMKLCTFRYFSISADDQSTSSTGMF